jgi:hypothetical protein
VSAINRPGTIVRVPDGRIGTVVYNGLDGVGIKWGVHHPDPSDFDGTYGGVVSPSRDMTDFPWEPDAMLRDPYSNPEWQTPGLEYVGEDYRCEIVEADQ